MIDMIGRRNIWYTYKNPKINKAISCFRLLAVRFFNINTKGIGDIKIKQSPISPMMHIPSVARTGSALNFIVENKSQEADG